MNETLQTQVPALLRAARDGNAKFYIQFGGQGNSWLREMRSLYNNHPELKIFFNTCFQAVNDFVERPDVAGNPAVYLHGFKLKDWLEEKEEPPVRYLYGCAVSFPCNQITQLAYLYLLTVQGFALKDLVEYSNGAIGHSQGLQAAIVAALGKEGDAFLEATYQFVHWFCGAGYTFQRIYGWRDVPGDIKNLSHEMDGELPSQMTVVSGISESGLRSLTDRFNATREPGRTVRLSLVNHDNLHVLSAHAEDLVAFRREYFDYFTEQSLGWNYLAVTCPFHREDYFEDCITEFYRDHSCKQLPYTGADLKIPVYSFYDYSNFQEKGILSEILADTMALRPLNWQKTLQPVLNDPEVTHILDFGPGKISSILTKTHIKGTERAGNLAVHSAVGRSGLKKLLAT